MNLDKQLNLIIEKRKKDLFKESGWIRIHKGLEPLLCKLGRAFVLYAYLCWRVNRDENAEWANLGKYWKDKKLACAFHHSYIAKELDVSKRTIVYWIKKLVDLGLVKKLGTEKVERYGNELSIDIYGLGCWDWGMKDGRKVEVDAFYHEIYSPLRTT